MQGAGPGTLLGGRYALRHRLTQGRDLERWSAHDSTLEREVTLTIVDSDHPNRAGILDAARSAAGVEDTRLVRILDVGAQEGNSYIVEESMIGAESLATVLLQGPLPGEEARRIAGETARGLETAGQRGLHHLRLTPHSVLIAPDGAIRVSGVAVAAAIDWPDEQEPDPVAASRRDAVCVVAVAYAALTSRWPLEEQISGVESAPALVGGPAAPSEIAAGVPADLDALCRTTFNEGTGPLTPGAFANEIAPWSREQVHRGGVEPTVVLQLPLQGHPMADVPVAAGTEPTVAIAHLGDTAPSRESAEATSQVEQSGQVPGPSVGDKAAAAGAIAGKAVGTALASAGAAVGAVGGKLGSLTRSAAGRGDPAGANPADDRMTLPEAFSGSSDRHDEVETPLPMLPSSTAQPPGKHQSKVVVLIVAAFVGLALAVGYWGAKDLGKGVALPDAPPTRAVATGAPEVTAPPEGPTAPAGGAPVAILSATGFDPEGDRNEKNGQAGRVYDGNPATAWTSEGYNSAEFGKLKKGVGVLLDLGQPTSSRGATLDLGKEPVDITLYAATSPSIEGATVIGTATAASGRIQLNATGTIPEAQFIIVWFTRLAPDGGQFRATISEIALT